MIQKSQQIILKDLYIFRQRDYVFYLFALKSVEGWHMGPASLSECPSNLKYINLFSK